MYGRLTLGLRLTIEASLCCRRQLYIVNVNLNLRSSSSWASLLSIQSELKRFHFFKSLFNWHLWLFQS